MRKIFLLFYTAVSAAAANAAVHYVTPTGAGVKSGGDWANAYDNIAAAVTAAASGDEVWVAQGTYSVSAALTWKNGVNVYGGFVGSETGKEQRSMDALLTVITNSGGSYRILAATAALATPTTWSGFTIQGSAGGGVQMHANSILDNCVVRNNTYGATSGSTATYLGGGILADAGGTDKTKNVIAADIVIQNCKIINNQAGGNSPGGGIYARAAGASTGKFILKNCVIANNRGGNNGGGIAVYSVPSEITNCTFVKNIKNRGNTPATGGWPGGAIYLNTTKTAVANCIFWGNEDTYTAAKSHPDIYIQPAVEGSSVKSCIVSRALTQGNGSNGDEYDIIDKSGSNTHVKVENVTTLTTPTTNAELKFTSPSSTVGYNATATDILNAGWSIQSGSVAVNAGSSEAGKYTPTDIVGRLVRGVRDIGAYEYFEDIVIAEDATVATDYNVALHGDVIFKSSNASTGQWSATSTAVTDGVVRVVKTFTTGKWYPVGFPFELASVSYEGQEDSPYALQAYDKAVNFFVPTTEIAASKGYLIQFPVELGGSVAVTFTSVKNPTLVAATAPDGYDFVANPSFANAASIAGVASYYTFNPSYTGAGDMFSAASTTLGVLKPFEAVVATNATGNLLTSIGTGIASMKQVTVSAGERVSLVGTPSVPGVYPVGLGDPFAVRFSLSEGYANPAVTLGRSTPYTLAEPTNGVYTVTLASVDTDTSISITADTISLPVSVTSSAGVSVLSAPASVKYFSGLTLTFSLKSGYYTPVVTVNGAPHSVSVGQGGVYTLSLSDVRAAQTIVISTMGKNVVKVADDAFVYDGSSGKTTTYNTNVLTVKNDGSGYRRQAYLKFVIPENVNADEIREAWISLYLAGANGSFNTTTVPYWITYYAETDTWTETSLTWNNKPAASTEIGKAPTTTTTNANVKILITDKLREEIAKDRILSVCIDGSVANGKGDVNFYSKESTAHPEYAPCLIFTTNIPVAAGATVATDYDAAMHGDVIFESTDASTGQWSAGNTAVTNGVVKVVKAVEANKTYAVGFPFEVDAVDKPFATLKSYNGLTNLFEDALRMEVGRGYLVSFATSGSVTFTSKSNPTLLTAYPEPEASALYKLVPALSLKNEAGIGGATKYYSYNVATSTWGSLTNTIVGGLKPFEAVVVSTTPGNADYTGIGTGIPNPKRAHVVVGGEEHVQVTLPQSGFPDYVMGMAGLAFNLKFKVDTGYVPATVTIKTGENPVEVGYTLGAPVNGEYTVTVNPITDSATITITTKKQELAVTVSKPATGVSVTAPTGSSPYAVYYDSTFVLKFTVDEPDAYLPQVSVDAAAPVVPPVEAGSVYAVTLPNVKGNHTVAISLAAKRTVTLKIDPQVEAGAVTVTKPTGGVGAYPLPEGVTFTYAFDAYGYNVQVNGEPKTAGQDHSITVGGKDTTLNITATPKTWKVTLNTDGTLTDITLTNPYPSGGYNAVHRQPLSISLTVSSGKYPVVVLPKGVPYTLTKAGGVYTLTISGVTKDLNVVMVAFAENVLPVTEDTYVRGNASYVAANYAAASTLVVEQVDNATYVYRAYLRFDATELVKKTVYNKVELRLMCEGIEAKTTNNRIEVRTVPATLPPLTSMTWTANGEDRDTPKGDAIGAPLTIPQDYDKAQPVVLDVTSDYILGNLKDSVRLLVSGVYVKGTWSDGNIRFYSKENTLNDLTLAPQLIFSQVPSTVKVSETDPNISKLKIATPAGATTIGVDSLQVEAGCDSAVTFTFEVADNKVPVVTVNNKDTLINESAKNGDTYTVTISHIVAPTVITVRCAEPKTCKVTVAAEHVTLTSPAGGETTVAYGSGATITFTVDEHYRNPQVTVGGAPYALDEPTEGVYTVTIASVTQDAAVRITASPQTFTLILAADTSVITLLSPQAQGEIPVDYGSSFTVSFRVAAGYEPVVSTNGTPVPAGAPNAEGVYTVTAVQQVAAQDYFVSVTAKVATPSAVSKEDTNDPVVRVQYYTVMGVETPKPAVSGVYVVKRTLASKKITVRKELVIVR